jgi:hypothetical protein
MFKVSLVKCVWTHPEKVVQESLEYGAVSSEEKPKVAILEKSLSLPFAPFIGLEITGDGWDSGPLKRVSWFSSTEQFRCTVADEYPRKAHGSELSYEFLLESSLQEGWVRPQRGGGDAPRPAT